VVSAADATWVTLMLLLSHHLLLLLLLLLLPKRWQMVRGS
jgi:hypothetical protein